MDAGPNVPAASCAPISASWAGRNFRFASLIAPRIMPGVSFAFAFDHLLEYFTGTRITQVPQSFCGSKAYLRAIVESCPKKWNCVLVLHFAQGSSRCLPDQHIFVL